MYLLVSSGVLITVASLCAEIDGFQGNSSDLRPVWSRPGPMHL